MSVVYIKLTGHATKKENVTCNKEKNQQFKTNIEMTAIVDEDVG
jgi:hypothetical protein